MNMRLDRSVALRGLVCCTFGSGVHLLADNERCTTNAQYIKIRSVSMNVHATQYLLKTRLHYTSIGRKEGRIGIKKQGEFFFKDQFYISSLRLSCDLLHWLHCTRFATFFKEQGLYSLRNSQRFCPKFRSTHEYGEGQCATSTLSNIWTKLTDYQ